MPSIPSAEEIFRQALKIDADSDVNYLHAKTFEIIDLLRDNVWLKFIQEFHRIFTIRGRGDSEYSETSPSTSKN